MILSFCLLTSNILSSSEEMHYFLLYYKRFSLETSTMNLLPNSRKWLKFGFWSVQNSYGVFLFNLVTINLLFKYTEIFMDSSQNLFFKSVSKNKCLAPLTRDMFILSHRPFCSGGKGLVLRWIISCFKYFSRIAPVSCP